MKHAIILVALLFASTASAVSYPPELLFKHEELATIEGGKFKDLHFVGKQPAIPKSWKLISVSVGEEQNSNNLWFQDSDGSVYLLQGGMSQKKLIIHENIYKIPAG